MFTSPSVSDLFERSLPHERKNTNTAFDLFLNSFFPGEFKCIKLNLLVEYIKEANFGSCLIKECFIDY